MNLIALIIAFMISLGACVYGVRNVLKKGTPLYFQLLVEAAALYTLEVLGNLVTEYCKLSEGIFSVSTLGIWGCFWFMFCANHGAMNGLIYDGNKPSSVLYAIPAIHTIVILLIGYTYMNMLGSLGAGINVVIVLLPAVPVIYWNVAHLFAKEDPFGIRGKIKRCDIASIIVNVLLIVLYYSRVLGNLFMQVMQIVCSCAIALLVYEATKGAKLWNI